MNSKEHVVFCIMGESASGKDKLVTKLCDKNQWSHLISFSTRPKRYEDEDTHIFVDEDTFQDMLNEQQVAVWTNIDGNYYWSTIDQLYESDFYIINPEGLKMLKERNLPNLRLVTVYINVPEDIRKERAMARGDDINKYRSRSLAEKQQFRDMKKNMDVDYVVPNIDFAKAYSVMKWIAVAEGVWKNNQDGKEE